MGQGRTLHDGGFTVSDWLWRPGLKCDFPKNDLGDRETQKLERKDFFQWIVEKVDEGVFSTVFSERECEICPD